MDLMMILIFIGFILSGCVIGYAIGFALGRRSMCREFDYRYEVINQAEIIERKNVLNAEIIE